MRYKPGDKVRIKTWDELEKENLIAFRMAPKMREYCGQIMTIKNAIYYEHGVNNGYFMEESGLYFWGEDLIEGLIKEELSYKEAAELYGLICDTNKCDRCPLGESQNECVSSFIEYSDEMQTALLEWKNRHKPKTNREKFIEIFGEEVFRNHTHQLNSFWQEEYKEEQ